MEAPPSLTDLPNELLHHSVSLLDLSVDVYHASLCSRRFYEIAHPLLYAHISLREKRDRTGQHTFPQLYPLTLVILRNPSLASRVQHLTLRDKHRPWLEYGRASLIEEEGCQVFDTTEIDPLLETAVVKFALDLNWRLRCIQDLKKRPHHVDVMLTILLANLPSLKFLDISLRPNRRYHLDDLIKYGATDHLPDNQPPVFGNLTDFMLASYDDIYGTDSNHLSFAMDLPSIRAVYGFRIGYAEWETHSATTDLKSKSSNLQHLELKDSRLPIEDLPAILKAPKALKTFIYELGDVDVNDVQLNLNQIREAVEAQSESLEELWLDYRYRNSNVCTSPERVVGEPIEGFTNFLHLRRLKIATEYLFGLPLEEDDDEGSDEETTDDEDDIFEEQSNETDGSADRDNKSTEESEHGEPVSVRRATRGTDGGSEGSSENEGEDTWPNSDESEETEYSSESASGGEYQTPFQSDSSLYNFDAHYRNPSWTPPECTSSRPIFDLFPPSLESLCLLHTETSWNITLDAVEGILEQRRLDSTVLANLTELVISGPILAKRMSWETLNSLQKDAHKQGIRLTTVDTCYPMFYENMDVSKTGKAASFKLSRERPWGFDSDIHWAECGPSHNRLPPFKEVRVPLTKEELAAMRALERQRTKMNQDAELKHKEEEELKRQRREFNVFNWGDSRGEDSTYSYDSSTS